MSSPFVTVRYPFVRHVIGKVLAVAGKPLQTSSG
jgi:hypothetical protein